jgi:hypothetical protein
MQHLLRTAFLSLVLVGAAWAEEKPAPPTPPPGAPKGPAGHPLMDRAFQILDANKDGKIDPDEFRSNMPKIVEKIRGEIGDRLRSFPQPERPGPPAPADLDRIIDEKVRAAVDRVLERRLPGPPPGGQCCPQEEMRGHAVRPPLGGAPRFNPAWDRDDRDRRERPMMWEKKPDRADRPERGGHRPGMALMFFLDTNRDGAIDQAEIDRGVAMLKKLDRNEDGRITSDEIAQAHKDRPAREDRPKRDFRKGPDKDQ